MAIYEYRYTDVKGKAKTVERRFKMSEAPSVVVVREDATEYIAERIISRTASMKLNWEVKGITSDLPDENSPLLG
jgi:hypothetical protein